MVVPRTPRLQAHRGAPRVRLALGLALGLEPELATEQGLEPELATEQGLEPGQAPKQVPGQFLEWKILRPQSPQQ